MSNCRGGLLFWTDRWQWARVRSDVQMSILPFQSKETFLVTAKQNRTQTAAKLLKLPPAHLLLRKCFHHSGWKPAFGIYCSNLKTSNHLCGPVIISTCTLQPESAMLCDESWPLTGRGHSSATWNMIPGVEVKRSLSQKSKCTPRCWGHLTQHAVIFLVVKARIWKFQVCVFCMRINFWRLGS